MKRLIILINLILAGCGTPNTFEKRQQRDIDPRLVELVELFEDIYKVKIEFEVKVVELDAQFDGWCRHNKGRRTIEISDKFFKKQYLIDRPTYLHQVVFHELGHCELYLDHNDDKDAQGNPVSIMSSYSFGYSDFYLDNIEDYLNSLVDERAKKY